MRVLPLAYAPMPVARNGGVSGKGNTYAVSQALRFAIQAAVRERARRGQLHVVIPEDKGDPFIHLEEGIRPDELPPEAGTIHRKYRTPGEEMEHRTAFGVLRQRVPLGMKQSGLFSQTSKMSCLSWSIPAGHPTLGGTCPTATMTPLRDDNPYGLEAGTAELARLAASVGARVAATMAPPGLRTLPVIAPASGLVARDDGRLAVNHLTSICTKCYAGKGGYGHPDTQTWQILRHEWTGAMFKAGRAAEWIDLMTLALTVAQWREQKTRLAHGQDPNYFRIHDSGDFFSPAYMAAWLEICRRLPRMRFWAPTRVWMDPHYQAVAASCPPNLVLRPSAIHFGDPPPVLDPARFPGWARGSSAAWVERDAEGGLVWQCTAYAGEGATCANARAPDCSRTCRYCWDAPHGFGQYGGSVRYAAH